MPDTFVLMFISAVLLFAALALSFVHWLIFRALAEMLIWLFISIALAINIYIIWMIR